MEPRRFFNAANTALLSYDHLFAPISKSAPIAQPTAGAKGRLAALAKHRKPSSRPVQTFITQGSASPLGSLTPAQMRAAYGVDAISFGGSTGDGTGQTIAIIDAGDYPNALSDLQYFDSTYKLADPPSFTKVNQNGGSSLPGQGNAVESALDIEWSHVMAPKANIILVECNGLDYYDLFNNGVSWARSQPAVSVISMSFGGQENSYFTQYDSIFTSPSTTHGVSFVASSGDSGKYASYNTTAVAPQYPASSPNVLAVGGTRLTISNTGGTPSYTEKGWGNGTQSNQQGYGGSGGGTSSVYAEPAYQKAVVPTSITTSARAVPDVSLDADPGSGVPVYDSSDYGAVNSIGGAWASSPIGGTSLSAPLMSGVLAVVNQGRVLNGLHTLDGPGQTLPAVYGLSASNFRDPTIGSNGYYASAGYDLVTGRGSPLGATFIPALVSSYSITGRVFVDANSNGVYDGTDSPLPGYSVYVDATGNGTLGGNQSAVTDSAGQYFLNDPSGSGARTVRVVSPPAGYITIATNANVSYGSVAQQTVNFAYFPTTYATSNPNSNYTLKTDATGTIDQIAVNGTVTDSVAQSLLSTLSFNLVGAGDTLSIDGSNGNPVPSGGITLTGAATGDALTVIGTSAGNDAFTVTSSSISFGANPISFSNVSALMLNPGTGLDALNVSSGSVTVTAQASGNGILLRNFSTLSVASNSSALFATAPLHTDRMLVETSGLSIVGQLDLGGNDLIVHSASLSAVSSLIGAGYANGNWNGNGIASSAAHSDTTYLTALGVISNNNNGAALFGGSGQPLFDGQAPLLNDILVKYTYYGDADLSGQVDGSDYSRIDNGYLGQLSGWSNGDFNYDQQVDGSDYSLIDNAYNAQGTGL